MISGSNFRAVDDVTVPVERDEVDRGVSVYFNVHYYV